MRIRPAFLFLSLLLAPQVSSAGVPSEQETARLARRVEEMCGGKIRSVPKVVAVHAGRFAKEISRKLKSMGVSIGKDRICIPDGPAFYDETTNTVYCEKGSARVTAHAWVVDEVRHYRRMLLFHELVHAWQHQNIREMKAVKDSFVAGVLREGHAEWCTREFARKEGVERLHERVLRHRESDRHVRKPSDSYIDTYFVYVESYRFFEAMAAHEPPVSIKDIFSRGLPTERQIVFPDEYLQGVKPPPIPLEPFERMLGSKEGKAESPRVSVVGLSTVRSYLRRIGLPPKVLENMAGSFLNGRRLDTGDRRVTVMAFDSSKSADRVFGTVLRDHRRVAGAEIAVQHHDGASQGTRIKYAVHSVTDKKNGKSVSTILVCDGKLVFECNIFGLRAKDADWRGKITAPLKDYLCSARPQGEGQ